MKKTDAIKLLGGTVTSAARAVRVSPAAVSFWPDELPVRIADRVEAALWRQAVTAMRSMCADCRALLPPLLDSLDAGEREGDQAADGGR